MGPRSVSLGGLICTGVLASEGVCVIWSCSYTVQLSVSTYYYSVWVHRQTMLLQGVEQECLSMMYGR